MKYNKAKLLEYVNKALAEHRKAWERKNHQARLDYEELRLTFLREYSLAWRNAASLIIEKCEANEPIMFTDLVQYKRYELRPAVFGDRPPHAERYVAPRELIAQRAMLLAIVEDEVDTKQLKSKDVLEICSSYSEHVEEEQT